MSIRAMEAVWTNSQAKNTQLLLLLAIANCADDDGEAWPSLDYLARRIRKSKAATLRHLDELCRSGELYVLRAQGKRSTDLYRLELPGVRDALDVDTGEYNDDGIRAETARKLRENCAETVVGNSTVVTAITTGTQRGEHSAMFGAIADACLVDTHLLSKSWRIRIGKLATKLRDLGASPEQVRGFGAWWSTNHWKGRKGESPTPEEIAENWRRYAGQEEAGTDKRLEHARSVISRARRLGASGAGEL